MVTVQKTLYLTCIFARCIQFFPVCKKSSITYKFISFSKTIFLDETNADIPFDKPSAYVCSKHIAVQNMITILDVLQYFILLKKRIGIRFAYGIAYDKIIHWTQFT